MASSETIVRVQGPTWETVIAVDRLHGHAGEVAAKLRNKGLAARKRGDEVLVNANAEIR